MFWLRLLETIVVIWLDQSWVGYMCSVNPGQRHCHWSWLEEGRSRNMQSFSTQSSSNFRRSKFNWCEARVKVFWEVIVVIENVIAMRREDRTCTSAGNSPTSPTRKRFTNVIYIELDFQLVIRLQASPLREVK